MSKLLLSDVKAALERAVGENQSEKHWLLNFNKADMSFVMATVTVCRQESHNRRVVLRFLSELFHQEEIAFARDREYVPIYKMDRERVYYLSTYFNHLMLLPVEWGGMVDEILDILTIKEDINV